jgi:hypothetical protein
VLLTDGPYLADGEWHFIVLSYSSVGRLRFFADGQLVHTEHNVVVTETTGDISCCSVNGDVDEFAFFPHSWGASARARAHYEAATQERYGTRKYADFVKAAAPAYYLRLGERDAAAALDSSPAANHGSFMPDAATGPSQYLGLLAGEDNHGRYFDGVNDSVVVSASPTLYVGSTITMMALVNLPSVGRTNPVCGYTKTGAPNGPVLAVVNGGCVAANFVSTGPGSRLVVSDPGVVVDGQTHHLAVTFDGAVGTLYVDGLPVKVTTFVNTLPLLTDGYDVTVGRSSTEYLLGIVDEVSIDAHALTAEKILALANAALTSHLNVLTVTDDGYLECAPESIGSYQIPDSSTITLQSEQIVNVSATWTVVAVRDGWSSSAQQDVADFVPDADAIAQSDTDDLSRFVTGYPMIDTSADGVNWDGWRKLDPSGHRGMAFRLRFVLASLRAGIRAQLRELSWTVDMPDVRQYGEVQLLSSATGPTQITFATPFQAAPGVQVTILNAASGDWALITSQAATGFKIDIFDSTPARATRTVSWVAVGY